MKDFLESGKLPGRNAANREWTLSLHCVMEKKVWPHLFLSGKAGVDLVESATENAEFASTLRSNKSGQ